MNPECPAQVREKLVWFTGRKQMDIDGLGEKTIDTIRAHGIPLNTFSDVFLLSRYRDELLAIRWRPTKSKSSSESDEKDRKPPVVLVDNLLKGVEAAKSRGLARLLSSMGVRHVGETTAKQLAKIFRNADELLAATEEQLRPKSVPKTRAVALGWNSDAKLRPETGLGLESAKVVHEYLQSDVARRTFAQLKSVGVDTESHDYKEPSSSTHQAPDNPFRSRTVVVTGTFSDFDRTELEHLIEWLGGKVSGSVSKRTDLLVVGSDPGQKKVEQARSFSTPLMDENDLRQVLAFLPAPPTNP
jgi:DNA ligase (NAD+)